MHVVLYRRIAMAIETASKVGVLIDCCFVVCRPGSRQGDTEQVVTRWWLPGASSVALDLVHQAMPHALLQRVCMAIEMASNGGIFVCYCQFYHQP